MSRRKPRKPGECVYCGKYGELTIDHIPHKSLFAKPRPSNLVKVPCCRECHSGNKQVSLDDEYLRTVLTLRSDVGDHSDVKQILPTVIRSLKSPERVGFKKTILQSMRQIQMVSKSGLVVGMKPGYQVDHIRVGNVIKRIIRGLFYHEKGYRLPDEYAIAVYAETDVEAFDADTKQTLIDTIIHPILANEPKVIGNIVFSYRIANVHEGPKEASAWIIAFYGRISFLCLLMPEQYPI